jgi:hypothetical protein
VTEDEEGAGTLSAADVAEAMEARWLRIRQRQIEQLEAAAADCNLTLGESDMMPVVFQRVCVVCKVRDGWATRARPHVGLPAHPASLRHERRTGVGIVLMQGDMRLCSGGGRGASAPAARAGPQ